MINISFTTKKAYTLVELPIVLVIIAIFLSSGLNIFTNNIVQTKTLNTKEKLNIIYKSLAEHLMTTKRLPCPINLANAKDTNINYAFTDTNRNCASPLDPHNDTITIGYIPTRNLHLPSDMAEDAFGNKILYVVDDRLIPKSPSIFFNATNFFNSNSGGNGNIITDQNGTRPILLLLSFGANSCGSYKINGIQNANCANIDGAEQLENADNDANFITTSVNPKFDDVILTKTYYDFLQELNLTHTQAQGTF